MAAAFVALSLAGLWLSRYFLAAGFLGHAVWDVAHHRRVLDIAVPRWYVPMCIAYDVPVGLFIVAWS